MTIEKSIALVSLKPGADWVWVGTDWSGLNWTDSKITKPTEAEVNAEVTRLTNLEKANEYKDKRRAQYPAIGDQLDDLYKKGAFSDEMAAKIKKVKDDNPKP